MKIFLLCLVLVISRSYLSNAQHPAATEGEPPGLVKWMTIKEAQEQNKKNPKPFLIDFYTSWCGWCKHMMKTTYSTPGIADYINLWFYPVKFDAETKDTVYYRDSVFVNKSQGPRATHELTFRFLGDKISYPSTIFTTNNFQYTLNSSGYLDVKTLEPILIYIVENIFRTAPYDEFKNYFQKAFYDSSEINNTKLKWYSFKEALALNKIKPKKFIIDVYTNWCNGCRVMNKTTFPDTTLAEYINNNFYLVDFNAETSDTIIFNGIAWKNNHENGIPFHRLAVELAGNSFSLPVTIFLDENLQKLDVVQHYLPPTMLKPVIHFYGENAFRTSKWEEFAKNFKEKKTD